MISKGGNLINMLNVLLENKVRYKSDLRNTIEKNESTLSICSDLACMDLALGWISNLLEHWITWSI